MEVGDDSIGRPQIAPQLRTVESTVLSKRVPFHTPECVPAYSSNRLLRYLPRNCTVVPRAMPIGRKARWRPGLPLYDRGRALDASKVAPPRSEISGSPFGIIVIISDNRDLYCRQSKYACEERVYDIGLPPRLRKQM